MEPNEPYTVTLDTGEVCARGFGLYDGMTPQEFIALTDAERRRYVRFSVARGRGMHPEPFEPHPHAVKRPLTATCSTTAHQADTTIEAQLRLLRAAGEDRAHQPQGAVVRDRRERPALVSLLPFERPTHIDDDFLDALFDRIFGGELGGETWCDGALADVDEL